MSTIWKFLLLVVLLWQAMWFWGRAEPDASDSGSDAPNEVRNSAAADGRVGAGASMSARREAPSQSGSYVMAGADAQVADFHFDLGVIEPNESADLAPAHVVVGDVTGDRRSDVVMSLGYIGTATNRGRVLVRVYAQLPDGTLARPIEVDIRRAIDVGHGLELVDLDANGIPEVAVVEGVGLTILKRVNGAFATSWYSAPMGGSYLATVDADGDGAMDLFAQGWDWGADVFLGDGRGGIRGAQHIGTPQAANSTVEASDFTADGLADVLVQSGHAVRIYPSRYQSAMGAPIELDLAAMQVKQPWGMTVADMDQNGRPDLVVSDQGDENTTPIPKGVHILYRGAGNTFSRSVFLDTGAGYLWPGAVRIADVDGNGYPDVITMLQSQDRMGYFLQGPSGFAPMVTQLTDDDPYSNSVYYDNSFAIADVNSDRCPDVVLVEITASLRVFYGRNCRVTNPRPSGPLPSYRR
jgi:hypothetical protein